MSTRSLACHQSPSKNLLLCSHPHDHHHDSDKHDDRDSRIQHAINHCNSHHDVLLSGNMENRYSPLVQESLLCSQPHAMAKTPIKAVYKMPLISIALLMEFLLPETCTVHPLLK